MHEVCNDLVLNLLWELHGPHDGLNKVHGLSEVRVFLVDRGHDGCHVTEDKGRDDRPNDDHQAGDDCLTDRNRTDLSSNDQQNSVVEDHRVLVEEVRSVEGGSVGLLILARHP